MGKMPGSWRDLVRFILVTPVTAALAKPSISSGRLPVIPPVDRIRLTLGLVIAVATAGVCSRAHASEPVRVTSEGGPDQDAKQPQVAVDAKGRIFVAFGRGDTVRLAVSEDGGKTFTTSTVGSPGTLALGMRRGPRVAVTETSVVVTAIGGAQGKGRDGDVVSWRSTDLGKTWSGPNRVNTVVGSAREGLHGMASGPDGRVFCTWLDLRNGRMEIFGARSEDGGAIWQPDALVYRSPGKSVCECCHPSAAFGPDGTLYVMWRNSLNGARDHYLARSTDGGQSFHDAAKLGRGSWQLNACPMDGGAVAVGPGGKVETVWMRGGRMFSAEPGSAERSLGRGVQGWAAFATDGPFTVWLESRPGRLLARLPQGSTPLTLAEHANDPVVACGPNGRGPVVAAWESKAEGGGLFAQVLSTGQ